MSANTQLDYILPSIDYTHYVMSPDNPIISERAGGRGKNWTILTYADRSEWVVLKSKLKERFCGFLYLEYALQQACLNTVKAAPNKIALYQGRIVCLSQYCGEEIPNYFEHSVELKALQKKTRFIDTFELVNLRKKDGVIYVFDTEKFSFEETVHEEIAAFSDQLHATMSFFKKNCLQKNTL